MVIIFCLLIIANILALYFKIESQYFFFMAGSIVGLYKGINSEKFKHIFNFHRIKFRLTKEHILELIVALLLAILPFHTDILELQFDIIYFIEYIAFSLFLYRFLSFNLFTKQISQLESQE